MHIHILGICGTFMAGLAMLAKEKGYHVTGSDQAAYPPMSTLLASQGIAITPGYEADSVPMTPDYFVMGNALTRGMPIVEQVLNGNIPYTSGPAFLAEHVLRGRQVIAVAGTHGKTTTSGMIAWILECAGLCPGFLIGGMPENFDVSARLGSPPFFVIEADEYDSAFFDKRSKFVHYRPNILVLNNCEFDHADIFENLEAIKKQFHHVVRTVPSAGHIVSNASDATLKDILRMGCWTPVTTFLGGGDWQAELLSKDGSAFRVMLRGKVVGEVKWGLLGMHNVHNALAAIASAYHAGVSFEVAIDALCHFLSVKRRLEVRGTPQGITVYDDFAHHPSAIETTLAGLRAKVGPFARVIGVLDCASYTMCSGAHSHRLRDACAHANVLFCKKSRSSHWNPGDVLTQENHRHYEDAHAMIKDICNLAKPGDHIVIMSNGGFDGLQNKLLTALGGLRGQS